MRSCARYALRMLERQRAVSVNERGRKLADAGDDAGAEVAYRQAIDSDPAFEQAWFNLGLVFKRRRDWSECLRCNLRATDLDPRKEQPAWWNMGIAATALHDWVNARRAWNGYGINIPDGEGPIGANFGPTPVRVGFPNPTEVVWCRRIDPARAVIESIPLPESGHRHGDVVLHDGAPNGQREAFGRIYSVFDELERWQPSDIPTVVVSLTCPSKSDAKAICDLADAANLTYEDWTANINWLCKACSEGLPHSTHDQNGDSSWRTDHNFGFSADPSLVRNVIGRWVKQDAGRQAGDIRLF
jgi:tetratricopeptide (TPR) repeat protein